MSTTEHFDGAVRGTTAEVHPGEFTLAQDTYRTVLESWQYALRYSEHIPEGLWPETVEFYAATIAERLSLQSKEEGAMSILFADALLIARRRVELSAATQADDKARKVIAQNDLVAARTQMLIGLRAFDELFVRSGTEIAALDTLTSMFVEATTIAAQGPLSDTQKELTARGVHGLLAAYKVKKVLDGAYSVGYALPAENKHQYHRLMVRRAGKRLPLQIVPSSKESQLVIRTAESGEASLLVPTQPEIYPPFSLRLAEQSNGDGSRQSDREKLLAFTASRF